MRRLAVYVFWEQNGIVRDYVSTYLKGLTAVANKLYVVVNGEICPEGRRRIEQETGAVVLQRPNEGVDFWAYKTALDHEGETISDYDEVILCNCSCYGPIYPFNEMFEEMGKRDVDFWGITEWPLNEGGYRGTWILSYFMVFRPHILSSLAWKEYWKNLSPVYSREECIEKHETKFTSYFSELGFSYDVYCPNTINYIDPTIEAPDKLVIEQRCPIIKRKAFCAEYNRFLSYHRGASSRRVFDYIKEQKLYDTDIILDDLLATQHYAYIKDCLQLNYILPSYFVPCRLQRKPKIVVCIHLYYEDLVDTYFRYMRSIPEYADVYITTPKENLVPILKNKVFKYQIKNVKIELINARGRAESAFLVATKSFIQNYEYACILHDKKSSFLHPGCIGLEFGLHNIDALLKTANYVENILSIFEKNPRLGILEPVNLMYANFRGMYGYEWGENYQGTVDFLKRANIHVPIDAKVPPVAPMGAMFWFRPACMKKLLEIDWEYEDFPAEPLPLDGSLIHIIERSYPFFAQDAGYLTAWISSEEDAQVHLTNLSYLLRQANLTLAAVYPTGSVHTDSRLIVQQIGIKGAIKNFSKRHLPACAWNIIKKIYSSIRRKLL